jgi:hypothetical protein
VFESPKHTTVFTRIAPSIGLHIPPRQNTASEGSFQEGH